MVLKKTVLIGLLFAANIAAAGAQGIYFGPSFGYQRSHDADSGENLGGLTLRMKASPAFGMEGSILYRQSDFAEGDVTIRSWPVMATALFYPFPNIYGSIGGGWFYTTFDYSEDLNDAGTDDDTTSEFGWHFGGGLELPFGDRILLSGDIRYVFLDYNFEGLPGRDIDSNFFMITAGIHIRFK
jgi:opacity protein-like surface antigen